MLDSSKKIKAAILDRDGVICEYKQDLVDPSQFYLRKDVGQAIHKLNENGFLVLVATNQPDIAKGKMSIETLNSIHDKMIQLLIKEQARIDKIYYCPHRVTGIVPELSIDCLCRKPKPGLLQQAFMEFGFDKTKSFMIGDTWRDTLCARKFGIPVYGLTGGGGYPYPHYSDEAKLEQPDGVFTSLDEAVNHLISKAN